MHVFPSWASDKVIVYIKQLRKKHCGECMELHYPLHILDSVLFCSFFGRFTFSLLVLFFVWVLIVFPPRQMYQYKKFTFYNNQMHTVLQLIPCTWFNGPQCNATSISGRHYLFKADRRSQFGIFTLCNYFRVHTSLKKICLWNIEY